MEKLQEKEKNTELLVIDNKRGISKIHKENKLIKFFVKLLKLILKLTVIVAIYSAIFSVVVYYSNQFMVEKLRESEANRKVDPVLEALKQDKQNAENEEEQDKEEKEEKEKEEKEKEDKKENKKKTNSKKK